MTFIDRTSESTLIRTRLLGWTTAITALVSVSAVTVLTLAGHTEAAEVVGTIGVTACLGAGITQITVNVIRR
ncbi:hypothetical protein [Streptomyces sp. KL2]|uniref:hypothetical protein n=1 Tax=Streptomyces sp. KL2 TaxID=3050126 RepID=UPI00397B78BA